MWQIHKQLLISVRQDWGPDRGGQNKIKAYIWQKLKFKMLNLIFCLIKAYQYQYFVLTLLVS